MNGKDGTSRKSCATGTVAPLWLGRWLFLAATVLLWLAPFFTTGWTNRRWRVFPVWWGFQHSAAGLFTKRSTVWWDHHLEVELADGARAELPERGLFAMGTFGFRTRYDRIMNESNRSRIRGEIRQRLAEHVTGRLEGRLKSSTGDAAWQTLRLVRALWQVGAPEMASPAGAWNPPPVMDLPAEKRAVLGAYRARTDGTLAQVERTVPPKSLIVLPTPKPAAGNPRVAAGRATPGKSATVFKPAAGQPPAAPRPVTPQRIPQGAVPRLVSPLRQPPSMTPPPPRPAPAARKTLEGTPAKPPAR